MRHLSQAVTPALNVTDVFSRRVTTLMVIALVASMATIGLFSMRADAGSDGIGGHVIESYGHRDGPAHSSFDGVTTRDNGAGYRVCAGATQNGSFYASYICGSRWASHCYDGTRTLAGRIHNGNGVAIWMTGEQYWGSDGVCP